MLLFLVATMALGVTIIFHYDKARRTIERESTYGVYESMKQCGAEFEHRHGMRMDDSIKTRAFPRAFDLLYAGRSKSVLGSEKSPFNKFKPAPSGEGIQAAEASRITIAKHRMRTELYDTCPETVKRYVGQKDRGLADSL